MRHPPEPDLSIIIVNWNSTGFVREAISSVQENTRAVSFEIVVVDNASPDNDVSLIEAEFPDVKVLRLKENVGFAGANNIGLGMARGRFLLFLNPDTKILGSAIDIMMEQYPLLPEAGIVGCKLLNRDLTVQTSCIQTFPTILNTVFDVEALRLRWPGNPMWKIGALFSSAAKPSRIDAVSGACMLVKRDIFERVGLFSEEYFMYAEDLDLCHKIASAGFTNWFIGQATIMHYGGQSSPEAWATPVKWRAKVQFLVKHRGRAYTFAFRSVMALVAVCRLLLLVPKEVFEHLFGCERASYSPARKWAAILKTLLSESGSCDSRSALPTASPQGGAAAQTATAQRGSSAR